MQIVSWNFIVVGLNPEELELLDYALFINFSSKADSEAFTAHFNVSHAWSMLTIFIKVYFVNAAINAEPIYLNKRDLI